MRKITIWLFVVFAFSPYLYAQKRQNRDEVVKELQQEIRQLQAQFEQAKRSYDGKMGQLQAKIEELEKERAIAQIEQPAPLLDVERAALALPDISVVGDIVGTFSDDKGVADRNRIVARKIELALQGYLTPGMRADVFAALHRHGDEYKAELCEGYISFLETPIPGLSVLAGKKLLGFGKLNPRHAHHWDFVDRPAVLESYFGDHGAVGQGINFSYLLPLPFFAQWDVGAWHIDHHACPDHHHDHHHHILGLAEETYSTRLWSSFALSGHEELEIGLSGLKSYGSHHAEHKDEVKIGGLDMTYRHLGPGARRWLFQNEFLFLDREVPAGDLDR